MFCFMIFVLHKILKSNQIELIMVIYHIFFKKIYETVRCLELRILYAIVVASKSQFL